MLRIIGNILWHIPFLGFLSALGAFLLGLLFTVLVVTAPIGLGLIQYSKFLLLPFSYSMVSISDTNVDRNPIWKTYSFIIMILYFPIGLILAICTAIQAIALCLTVVGIPVGIVVFKSVGTHLNPVGKICVHHTVEDAITSKKHENQIKKYVG